MQGHNYIRAPGLPDVNHLNRTPDLEHGHMNAEEEEEEEEVLQVLKKETFDSPVLPPGVVGGWGGGEGGEGELNLCVRSTSLPGHE